VAKSAPKPAVDTEIIYCGNNLDKLPELPDRCADLIYIDPPFNSNRNYEVFWGESKEKRAFEDRHESTKAYIDFMRPRCVELARVLKPAGSFYYHCDWHASHYVKVMLDQIFGEGNFVNEIVWKRYGAHNDVGQGSKHYGRAHDVLLFYNGGDKGYTWHQLFMPLDPDYVKKTYCHVDERTGKRYMTTPLTGPGGEAKGNPVFEWNGHTRSWRVSRETMQALHDAGELYYSRTGYVRRKMYLEESRGVPVQSLWTDIKPLTGSNAERLGYPTQKPIALLDRIIGASSSPGDVVLDAFCGCGTALVSAQQLGRRWIGIDVSPTACRVMAERLRTDCKLREGKDFYVRDLPRDEKQLRAMPPFEFQNWAVIALHGIPSKTMSGDMGIDGRIYPIEAAPKKAGKAAGELDFMDNWYPIQVKQRDKAGRPDIDAFEAVLVRERRPKGFFVSFDFTSDALQDINSFFRNTGKVIVPLTVRDILNEELAMKLA